MDFEIFPVGRSLLLFDTEYAFNMQLNIYINSLQAFMFDQSRQPGLNNLPPQFLISSITYQTNIFKNSAKPSFISPKLSHQSAYLTRMLLKEARIILKKHNHNSVPYRKNSLIATFKTKKSFFFYLQNSLFLELTKNSQSEKAYCIHF